MKRPSFSAKTVAEICNNLVKEGFNPTMQLVREKLGAGSPNQVLVYLRQWRADYDLANAVEEDLSLEFKQAALAECARKLMAVRQRMQKQIEERDAQITEIQELLKQLEYQMEELNNELKSLKKEAENKYIEYEGKLAAVREQGTVRVEQAVELKQKTEQQVSELQAEIKQLQEAKHQAEIKAAVAEARVIELEKQVEKKKNL